MSDKDKEVFETHIQVVCNKENDYERFFAIWQAACEHKQSEIDELNRLSDNACMSWHFKCEKLEAENSKLRKIVEVLEIVSEYTDHDAEVLGYPDGEAPTELSKLIKLARQCLKELEE